MSQPAYRIGLDFGGTKTSVITLDRQRQTLLHERMPTPHGDYDATIHLAKSLITQASRDLDGEFTIGIGIPGSLSPHSGTIQNANSTWLNGKPFKADLEAALGQTVRLANDANCFAISEATDGAAAGATCVFGVILGTGCGGAIVVDGRIVDGPRGTGGEWGHNPLPAPGADELPAPKCWCGRQGCIETWVSGPGLAADHERRHSVVLCAEDIARRAKNGCADSQETLRRHASRLARGLAGVINIIDPDCVVLGGGLSNMDHLYDALPDLIAPHVFADSQGVSIVPPAHGDDSGVRGAAGLWDA